MLCGTFAISGIRFAATRLISEEIGYENSGGIGAAMRRCMAYGTLFGFAAAAVLYLMAEPIGFLWVGDARTVMSLRICAFSMPCVSLCAAISGYFTACGRVWKPTLVHLIEQLSGIAIVAFLLLKVPYAVGVALIVSIIDILPILGTGLVLIPWAIIAAILGKVKMAVGVALLYIVMLVVRNIVEPKLVGQQMGLHPLATLISLFVGLQLFGIVGLFGFPITLSLILKLKKSNAAAKAAQSE